MHIPRFYTAADMTPNHTVFLNMHNWSTKGKVHVFSDKQINLDMDTIVSYVIQSGQVLEGGVSSVSVNPFRRLQDIWTADKQVDSYIHL